MAEQVYDWKRFWCPRSSQINLGDRGYLTDPESEYGKYANPELVGLEAIADVPCLVLLGEPGLGKSKTIEKEHKRISQVDAEPPVVLNLHAYGSEDRLVRKLFESQQFSNWVQGDHRLHIFLDSLDECLLRIENVTKLLAEEFKQYQDKTDRLFLRIVCRTGVWQSTFEEQLRQIWGKDQVKVTVNLASNQGSQPTTIIGTQNNYFNPDEALRKEIVDLNQFISELDAKHPNIQTETEAEQILDDEILAVQTDNPTRWQSLRYQMSLLKRQLLNPERHLQAAKATLIEVTKTAYEKSLMVKAIITYIDKLSEEPNHGA